MEIRDAFRGQRGIDRKAIALAALLIEMDEKELQSDAKTLMSKAYPIVDY